MTTALTAPTTPLEGDIWFDSTTAISKVWDGTTWKVIDTDVVTVANENNYTTLIIADHGNCETMMNPDGSPHTSHTTNPVPFILVDKDLTTIKDGVLGDIAPTILKLMGVEQPAVMTRHSLI